jgi:hypothetical protein
MKFQIVLESTNKKNATMADDEFEKIVRRSLKLPGFKLAGARSLDGIQARIWEPTRRIEKDDPWLRAKVSVSKRRSNKGA